MRGVDLPRCLGAVGADEVDRADIEVEEGAVRRLRRGHLQLVRRVGEEVLELATAGGGVELLREDAEVLDVGGE